MTYLGRVASGTSQTASTTQTITVSTAVAAGGFVVGGVALEASSSVYPTITVTDSRGNSYSSSTSANQGATLSTRLFWSHLTTGLQVGDTITITASASRNRWATDVLGFDDATTSDQFASAIGSTAAISIGPTGTTTTATELVVAAIGQSGTPAPTLTAGSGFTSDGPIDIGASTSNRSINMEWKYVTATGAQTATGTNSAAVTWAGVVQTFVQSAAPPPTRSGKVKVWNASASAWQSHPLKEWNASASAWQTHQAKGAVGGSWVVGK